VRASLLRGTIHLVTAADHGRIQPQTEDVLRRVLAGQFQRQLGGAEVGEIAAAGRELLRGEQRTRAEIVRALADRWPGVDPQVIGLVVTYALALVQVPPRGLWGQSGQARWALAEEWLGPPADTASTARELALRYLAAFGPATSADMRTWSGIAGLREVLAELRPELRVLHDEQGGELLDVPDGPLPDPETPAPVRFLPQYDNVSLSHANRERIVGEREWSGPFRAGRSPRGGILVDGFYRGFWGFDRDAPALMISGFESSPSDPAGTRDELVDEGERLAELLAPGSGAPVRFDP
jgi:hypothetical protein